MSDSGLDDKDLQLLSALQKEARITNADLARLVSLSPSGLQKRLKKLQDAGYVDKFAAQLNRRMLQLGLVCFVRVLMRNNAVNETRDFEASMQTMPYVLECHRIASDFDYVLKIVVRDVDHLQRVLRDQLTPIPAVLRTRSDIVLQTIKSTTDLPLEA